MHVFALLRSKDKLGNGLERTLIIFTWRCFAEESILADGVNNGGQHVVVPALLRARRQNGLERPEKLNLEELIDGT
jgi:hypothetical protein